MKIYVKVFLIVLIIAWTVFIWALDLFTDAIDSAKWGLSYIPLELRAFIYLIVSFLLITIVNSLID